MSVAAAGEQMRSALAGVQSLRSARLELRRFTPEFVTETYVAWLNDPEVRRWLVSNQGGRATLADVAAYVDALTPDQVQFAILHDGQHIGNIKIYDLDTVHRRMEVGYMIGERAYWGRGVATEAVGRVVAFCFDDVGLHKMTSGCFDGHQASARVLEKNRFELEGVLRDHFRVGNGYVNFRRYGRLAG